MGRLGAASVIGVVTLLVIAWVQAGEATLQISMRLRSGTPAIVSFDLTSDGRPLASTVEDGTLVYSNSTYRMDFSESAQEKYSIVRLRISRKDGQPFELAGFAFSVRIPASELKGIWYPSAPSLSNDIMAGDGSAPVRGIADANEGIPYIAAAGIDGQNIIAIGLARQDLPVEIEADPLDLDRIQLRLHARSRRTAEVFEETFYVSNDTSINWFDTAANYADWADQVNGYSPMPVSSLAYEPLYDLWYFTQDRVDENL